MNTLIRSLHIDDALTWRGGEAQAFNLVKRLPHHGIEAVFVAQPGSELLARCRDAGLPVHPVRMRGELDVHAVLALRRLIRALGVQIVHSHTAHAHTLGALATLGMKDVRLIAHRRVNFHLNRNPLSWLKYRLPHAYVAISRAIRDTLIEDGISRNKIHHIPSGVALDKFTPSESDADDLRREFNLPPDSFLCGTVAALAPCKALDMLLDAAHLVVRENPKVRFLIVGTGELETDLKMHCHSLGLDNHVIFTGFRSDVGKIMKALDVFVLTSQTEGLGTAILDAMLLSLPVVASRVGGIPEMIEEGVNGLLCERGDAAGCAKQILTMLRDDALRQRCIDNASKTVCRFDIEATARLTADLYRKLAFA